VPAGHRAVVGGGGPKHTNPAPNGFGVVATVAAGDGQKLLAGPLKAVAVVLSVHARTHPEFPHVVPLGQHVISAPEPQRV